MPVSISERRQRMEDLQVQMGLEQAQLREEAAAAIQVAFREYRRRRAKQQATKFRDAAQVVKLIAESGVVPHDEVMALAMEIMPVAHFDVFAAFEDAVRLLQPHRLQPKLRPHAMQRDAILASTPSSPLCVAHRPLVRCVGRPPSRRANSNRMDSNRIDSNRIDSNRFGSIRFGLLSC